MANHSDMDLSHLYENDATGRTRSGGKGESNATQKGKASKFNSKRDALAPKSCRGIKTDGRQINARFGPHEATLMDAAVTMLGFTQTQIMVTAFLEFCDRYNITVESKS